MTVNIKNPKLHGISIQDCDQSVDRYPDCLPPATKAALENLRNYPPNWNYPNSSPLPNPADISLLGLYMACTLSDIPQPDIGWSADRTFLLYWTGKTRHVDVEIFPKEFHADLVAYNINKPRQWLGKSLDLYDPASWQEIARLAQQTISQKSKYTALPPSSKLQGCPVQPAQRQAPELEAAAGRLPKRHQP